CRAARVVMRNPWSLRSSMIAESNGRPSMAALLKTACNHPYSRNENKKPAGWRVQGLLQGPCRAALSGARRGCEYGSGEIQLHPGHHHAARAQRAVEALLELLAQCAPVVGVRLGLAVQCFQRAAADQLVGLLDHRVCALGLQHLPVHRAAYVARVGQRLLEAQHATTEIDA